jgi:hypothetical protein
MTSVITKTSHSVEAKSRNESLEVRESTRTTGTNPAPTIIAMIQPRIARVLGNADSLGPDR